MSQLATPKQVRYLRVLLTQTGESETFACLELTAGRTDDAAQLTTAEAHRLIQNLRAGTPPDSADVMRKKLLHFAHEMDWKLASGRVDVGRVDFWCQRYGQYHKPLMEHTPTELAALVTQFESVYRTFLRDLRK